MVQILVDRDDQLCHVLEMTPAKTLVGQVSEPPLDQVQPGTERLDKVQMKSWMSAEP